MSGLAYASVRLNGRLTGAVYLAYFVLAIGGQTLASHAGVTAGIIANTVATLAYAAVVVLLFGLFYPENATRSAIAAAFGLAGCIVTLLVGFHMLPARVSPLLFFGPYCALIGYLIVVSRFVPRALGVLLVLAGIAWLAFAAGLLPGRASVAAEALGIVAEAAFMLWLLAFGINMARWNARATAADDGGSPRAAER